MDRGRLRGENSYARYELKSDFRSLSSLPGKLLNGGDPVLQRLRDDVGPLS